MKFAVVALVSAFAASVAIAEDARSFSLDGGVSILLPVGWNSTTLSNPANKMASMKAIMHGASETRLRKGDTGVLVSFMHFKSDKPEPVMDTATLTSVDEITRKIGAKYLRQPVETEVTPRSQISGVLGISLATLTAREGERFSVAPNYPGGCVTTGSIRRGGAAWAISVASDSCDTATHKEAVEAMFAARSE